MVKYSLIANSDGPMDYQLIIFSPLYKCFNNSYEQVDNSMTFLCKKSPLLIFFQVSMISLILLNKVADHYSTNPSLSIIYKFILTR